MLLSRDILGVRPLIWTATVCYILLDFRLFFMLTARVNVLSKGEAIYNVHALVALTSGMQDTSYKGLRGV